MKPNFTLEIKTSALKVGLVLYICFLSSCMKEDPAEVLKQDFISYMSGDWEVDSYSYSNSNSPDTIGIDVFKIATGTYAYQYIVQIDKDSIYVDSQEYNISNDNFCKLSKANKLQEWTIKLEGDLLMLYASSLCGGYNESFEIVFSNLSQYMLGHEGSINADILLVNQNSNIIIDGFVVYNGHVYEGTSLNFSIKSDVIEHFRLVRK